MADKISWSKKDEIIWNNVVMMAATRGWNDAELARQSKTLPQTILKIKRHTRGIGRVMQKRFSAAFGLKDEGELLTVAIPPETSSPHAPPVDAATVRDLFEMQKTITRLEGMIIDMGKEIGDIKTRMIDAAISGEIHRLGIIGGKGR